MKNLVKTALILSCLWVVGCLPSERLGWSPDGKCLAVVTPAGLRLSTPDGLLSPATCEGVHAAAWLPDSSGLVVMRQTELDSWDAAKALVPAAEATRIEELAEGIPDLATALLKVTGGDDDKLEPLLQAFGFRDLELLGLAYHCALQTRRAALEAALASHGTAKLVKELLEAKPSFKVNEIAVVLTQGEQSLGAPRPLVRSLFPLGAPVPAPEYPLVAFTAGKTLRVVALDGSALLEVADSALGPCAWSPDGLSLVHLVPTTPLPQAGEDDLMLAELRQNAVVDAAGNLLERCPLPTTLAAVAVAGPQRLAVLPDGRILFASMATTLPATPDSMAKGEQLFLLDPALGIQARPVPVVVDPAGWSGSFQYFVLSPDGKMVAVVDGGSDAVALLELATGKVEIVAPDRGHKCRTLPAWRYHNELSFVAFPNENSERPEVMHLTPGQPMRVLSGTWEANIVNPLLETPSE